MGFRCRITPLPKTRTSRASSAHVWPPGRRDPCPTWSFKNFSYKILVIWANFDEFWWFWYRLQNFENVFVTSVRPYWDKFWKISILLILWYRKVMINHRGGILIFGQILNFGENRNFEILNPSSNPNFGSLTLNPNFRFWQIMDISSI